MYLIVCFFVYFSNNFEKIHHTLLQKAKKDVKQEEYKITTIIKVFLSQWVLVNVIKNV